MDEIADRKWWVVRAWPFYSLGGRRRRRFTTHDRAKTYAEWLRLRGYYEISIGYLNPLLIQRDIYHRKYPPRWQYDSMISNWTLY